MRRWTRSSSAPDRTALPRRSRSPGPGGRSGSTRRADRPAAGTRTAELTLPGFRHDVCATILPLIASPFFRLDRPAPPAAWTSIHPDAPLAHPLDGGRAVVLERSRRDDRGRPGAGRRTRLAPPVRAARPRRRRARAGAPRAGRPPATPSAGARPVRPAGAALGGRPRPRPVPRRRRPGRCSPGLAAHSMLRLDRPLSASFGLVLATAAHAGGWPMVRGGVGALAGALVAELEALGGEIVTGQRIETLGRAAARPRRRSSTSRRASSSRSRGDRLSGPSASPGGGVPLRPGRLQGRLGARRPGPVDRRRVRGARPRSTSAARSTRSPRPRRTSPPADIPTGPFVLFVQYAPWDPSRAPDGQDDRLGVLPRPGRLGRGHDRADRGPGRALRARVPRPDPRPGDPLAGGDGGVRREPRRRRHQRRHPGHPPARVPAVAGARSVPARRRAVPVLVVDAARRRGPWHERVHAARSALRHELR